MGFTNVREGSIMWIYTCPAGQYKENHLILLLFAIIKHRFHHLLKGEGFRD